MTQTNTGWLRYSNQSATRNLPISQKLQNAMSFLPQMGIQMQVFSGGQPEIGTSSRRTGSVRHDLGDAADVYFFKDGRQLDWRNPSDIPVFQNIVQTAKANGVTGFGAGDHYMSPGSMHVGFGTPLVWGAGGHPKNAPDWLKAAYYGKPAAGQAIGKNFDPISEVIGAATPMAGHIGTPVSAPTSLIAKAAKAVFGERAPEMIAKTAQAAAQTLAPNLTAAAQSMMAYSPPVGDQMPMQQPADDIGSLADALGPMPEMPGMAGPSLPAGNQPEDPMQGIAAQLALRATPAVGLPTDVPYEVPRPQAGPSLAEILGIA